MSVADEAEIMDGDNDDTNRVNGAAPPACLDEKGESEQQTETRTANGAEIQDQCQDVFVKAKHEKIKKRKAVINDSDDD